MPADAAREQADLARLAPQIEHAFGLSTEGAELRGGQFHDVVLLPGCAAIRVAREGDAAEVARHHELLRRLGALGLPFMVPEPLADIETVDDRPALATAWIPGQPSPRGEGEAAALRAVLDVLAGIDLDTVRDVLTIAHAYAGGEEWAEVMLEQAVPRLPARWRDEARSRIQAALDLEPVPELLVHGDLAGDNMRWSEDGRLVGILDWDLASPWDQAVDVACLAWHGWENVRKAVDEATYERARTWYRTFGIEQIASALVHGESEEAVEQHIGNCVQWLERTTETERGN